MLQLIGMAGLTKPALLALLQSTYPHLKHPDSLVLINGQK